MGAVDAEGEPAILGATRHLMRGRSVILFTHRPKMLEECTALLVLENGRIVAHTRPTLAGGAPRPAAASAGARRSNLRSHPAVRAWCQLYPHTEPLGITPLKVRRKKNQVYRLELADRAGAGGIGQRCP